MTKRAEGEWTPKPDAVEQARKRIPNLRPWQNYFLDCFPEKDYINFPEELMGLSGIWRSSTWEHVAHDTVHCYGTQMATLLSMAYKPKVIVEMGVYCGLTTAQFCKLNPNAKVYGVDLHKILPDYNDSIKPPIGYSALLQKVNNLELILGKPSWEFSLPDQVDLCFIDGNHMGDAPYRDSLRAWDNRNTKSDWCIAWDDYHPNNPDVKNAVDRFCKEVKMGLHELGSWVYIGTLPHSAVEAYK